MVRRVVQLMVSTAVLGVGIALILDARLGSDGYSMLIDGAALLLGWPFAVLNVIFGVVLVGLAWARGRQPGLGTIAMIVVVGSVVSAVEPLLPEPQSLGVRVGEFVVALVVICFGVAGYLAADLGAGPAEAAALAWDPPVPFRWSYTAVQVTGAVLGWAFGAELGIGTVIVSLVIGPVVDRLLPYLSPGGNQ